jgi:hypothetical protein
MGVRQTHLIVVTSQLFDNCPELIGNVKFVGIKQKYDQISSLRKPSVHLDEVVASGNSLLLSTKYSGSIDDGDVL